MGHHLHQALATVAASALALTACTAGPAPRTNGSASTTSATLTVFAAASLKGAFTDIATQFSAEHPGVRVKYNFDGSSTLVDQLKGGAPADVFASADDANMTKATEAALVTGTPKRFATNTLTLVVAPGNPKKITGLDASLDGTKLVVCAPSVPCGNAYTRLAKKAGLTLKPVSLEQKVTDVLGKVTSGEADAGVVYATDAKAAGDKITAVAIKDADKVVNNYPIAITASSKQAALASSYVDFVTGTKGQAVLATYAFGKP